MANRNTNCIHHEQDLAYFCETCKEPVCKECMVIGPHQTKNHVIIELQEAFTHREQYIRERIEVNLHKKKDQLVDHLKDIDTRMHNIEAQRVVLEKDVQMEFEGGIIKRLNDAKGVKLAVLQKDVAQLQRNINELDDFIQTFEYLALTEQNVLPLLFMSKSFSKEMMKLLSIVVQVNIEITPFDLPRDLVTMRTELANSATLAEQIKFKKEVIWRAHQERISSLNQLKIDFYERMEAEIGEWVALVKRIVGAFDALCLICSFCGCFLSQDIINEDCKLNTKPYEEAHPGFNSLTEEQPKQKQFGNYQHYFANPKTDTLKKDKYPNFGDFLEQKMAAKEIYLRTFRTLWFSILDLKARKYLKSYDLKQIFEKYDKENTGWLNLIKFRYLLHKDLEMTVVEVDQLVNFFKDEKEDKINYAYFLNVDWYIDELQRLEEKLQQEQFKYKRLYQPKKPTRKYTPEKDREKEKDVRKLSQPVLKKQEQTLHPIYPYGMRFTQPDRKVSAAPQSQTLAYGFGFQERPGAQQALPPSQPEPRSNSLNNTQQPLKSILKSQSPAAPASRFQIAPSSSSSHLYKYYQQ